MSKDSFGYRGAALADVRDWLKEFGGIHVYQNGLRVTPYDDPGNDWLDMNLARARSPRRTTINKHLNRAPFDR